MVILGQTIGALRHGSDQQVGAGGDFSSEKRRLARVVLHVQDLSNAIDHYELLLSLRLLHVIGGTATSPQAAIMGIDSDVGSQKFALELHALPKGEKLFMGGGFGSLTLLVDSLEGQLERYRETGKSHLIKDELYAAVPVVGTYGLQDRVARVADADGYDWQLYEAHSDVCKDQQGICKVQIFVRDLGVSLPWYQRVLQLQLLHEYTSADLQTRTAVVGYGPENTCTVLELREKEGGLHLGNGFKEVHIVTRSIQLAEDAIREAGGEVQPVLSGHPSPAAIAVRDPDGWRYVLLDESDVAE